MVLILLSHIRDENDMDGHDFLGMQEFVEKLFPSVAESSRLTAADNVVPISSLSTDNDSSLELPHIMEVQKKPKISPPKKKTKSVMVGKFDHETEIPAEKMRSMINDRKDILVPIFFPGNSPKQVFNNGKFWQKIIYIIEERQENAERGLTNKHANRLIETR